MRSGAAFTSDNYLFVYQEMTPHDLSQALPLSYQSNKGNFFFVVFVNGSDFVGQMTEQKIDNVLQEMCPFNTSPLKYQYQDLVDSIIGTTSLCTQEIYRRGQRLFRSYFN